MLIFSSKISVSLLTFKGDKYKAPPFKPIELEKSEFFSENFLKLFKFKCPPRVAKSPYLFVVIFEF